MQKRVNKVIASKIIKLARNFATTISQSLIGEVSKSSKVPSFCSSANNRMVNKGGIRGIKKYVAFENNARAEASANAPSILVTKNTPVNVKKTPAIIYAIGEEK